MKKWLLFAAVSASLMSYPNIARAADFSSYDNGGWREVNGSAMKVWQTGAGSFPVAGDSVTIRHQVTSATNESIAHFYLISNSLALLPNTLTISGDSYWLSGSMDADIQFQGGTFTWNGGVYLGAFNNPAAATFVLAGDATKTLRNYAVFHNYGAVQQAGAGPLALNGNPNTAYLYNWTNALYDIQTDGTNLTANYGHFNNYGTLRKSAGAGTSVVACTFNHYNGTIEVEAGTLMLNAEGTRSNGVFDVAGGATLDLAGAAGPFYHGHFTGTGSGIVQLAGGQIGQDSDVTFDIPNGLYWRGGTLRAAYIHNQSLMLVDGPALKTIRYYGQLHNYGTIRHTGTGALAINGNPNTAYLYNWTNALYDIQSDGTNFTSDMGYFCNYGTFRKSAGAGTSVVASAFNNYNGTIEVQTGSLVLNGAGTRSNGVLDVAAGATLDLFGSAGAQYRGTFSGSGSGVVQIAGGELGIDCDITFNLINGLYWRGGNINRSFLRNDGLMFLDGAATKTVRYYGQLINNGDIRHTGAGNLSLIDGDARLINQSNNLYDIQSDGTNISGSGQVHNYGTLMKSVGGGTSWISSAYYHDNGTINVQTGTLVLAASGTRSNGVLDVAAGATLDLFGSASGVKYYGTFTGSGSGIVQIAGGVFGDDSRVTFDLPNGLYWRGGRLNRSYLQNDGLMFMDGPATKEVTLYGDVYNHGTIRHTGAGNLYLAAGSATRLYNYSNALYDIQPDGTNISGSGQVHNYGALCKSAGSGTSVVACTFYNYGGMVESRSGTLKFNSLTHTGGTLRLNGGDLSVPAFTLQAGLLEGTGTLTVAGTLSSSATVSPGLSAGILNIAGNYSQGAAGALDIEIGGRAAGSQHDRLDITGSAALNGTLNVALTNGFIPALTDAFTIVSCASRSGVFSGTNLPAIGADRRWVVVYSNTAVYLQVQGMTASLTAPTNGAVFLPPANVTLAATVTDTAGTVTQVAFYSGATLIGVSASSGNPYTYVYNAGVGTHSVSARARDDAGLMATSAPATFIVAPAAPAGVAASDGAYTDKVRVTWSASGGAAGYQVWRGTANNPAAAALLGRSAGAAYNDTGATPGTLYYYWVKATNQWAASVFSAANSGYRNAPAPTGVSASDAGYPDKIRVTWNAVGGATNYQVFRNTVNASGTAGLVATVAAAPYDDRGATAGTTYYYWVKARRGVATSAFSAADRGWRRTTSPRIVGDYDGDGLADPAQYNPATKTWKIWLSASGYAPLELPGLLGGPGYVPASADFDGDGKTDPAVYAEATGKWIVMLSSGGYAQMSVPGTLGGTGWSPCPADFDGDGKADPGVYAEGAGTWKAMLSGKGYAVSQLPQALGQVGWGPCPADFDGDGKADQAVYEEATGSWQLRLSASGYAITTLSAFLGGPGLVPMPADYDGDGLADPAVYKAATGEWRVRLSSGGYAVTSVVL